MRSALKLRLSKWLFRPKIEHGSIVLTQRRIFILPTRQGLALVLLLIVMLLGDINYSLSLGYMLTFLLAMMSVLSMLHAFRNLAQLEISAGRVEPVFSGETARFLLHFNSKIPRYQLVLQGRDSVCFDLPAGRNSEIIYPALATKRGRLSAGRLTLYTEFPLGLFHAWCYLHFDTWALIYPNPCASAPLPIGETPDSTGKRSVTGDDDFAGLRNYVSGDALPRIAWKAYARGHALQVKQFATQLGEEIVLRLTDAPEPGLEGKLSRMTRWVLDAERQGLRYGLNLPDSELNAGNGTAHRDECLRRLALYGLSDASPNPP